MARTRTLSPTQGVLLAGLLLAAALTIRGNLGSQYGFDFRGIWRASAEMLGGRDPYPAPVAEALLRAGNPFVVPPLLGLLVTPLAHVPFSLAVAIVNVICTVALIGALRLVGVRDARVYACALCSFPFVSSLALGQPDGLFALAAAVAWTHRDSPRGALAIALLIAVKLLAWPLLLWLLYTRRFRQALISAVGAGTLLAGSWALIGLRGLSGYRRLLSADGHAFAIRSHSVVALVCRLGGSYGLGSLCAVIVALGVAVAVVRRSEDRDRAAFAAALAAGLLVSPLLWSHYLVLLLVPLALSRPKLHPAWLLVAALWISPSEPPRSILQVALVLGLAVAIAAVGAGASRSLGRLGGGADQRPSETAPHASQTSSAL